MTSALIRDRQLCELIDGLDGAVEVLETIGFRGPGDDDLSLPLRESFAIKHAIERAADFLYALRYDGGGRS
jgi:hypothetical protein